MADGNGGVAVTTGAVEDGSGRVFLSYASADADVAQAACAALEAAGMRCWIAPRDVPPGAQYADAIVRALTAAGAVVLILSAHSVASTHVGKEIERASSKRRPILALRIDGAPLTPAFEYFLSESQWIDARAGDPTTVMPRLTEAVRRLAGTAAPAADPAAAPGERWSPAAAAPVAKRRGLRVPVVVLAIAGMAFVTVQRLRQPAAPLLATPSVGASASATAAAAAAERSIAVLPFTDMSEKKDQEYFSDGLSEELIDLLAKNTELHVPARTSSFYFKGKQTTVAEIARALGVSHVLEGSVRKAGATLRVTAQLIRADNGYHVWSETYDRKLDDVFKVQDEIANAVVGVLKVKLLSPVDSREHSTTNTEAYNQYLIGHELHGRGNWKLDHAAAAAFRRAVELDPAYAPAWAGLATAEFNAAEDTTTVEAHDALKRSALASAERAIAARPDLMDGYAARGFIRAWDQHDFTGAEADLKRALALDPDNASVQVAYAGSVLMPTGRLAEAIALDERALRSDPLNGTRWRSLGIVYLFHGDYAKARECLQKALEISPEQSNAAAYLGYTYLFEHQPERVLPLAQRATAVVFREQGAALAEHDLGHLAQADQHLAILREQHGDEGAYQIAEVYALWGDKERAYEWLERSFATHDAGLTMIKVDPMLSSLHGEPRYQAMLARMTLAP